MAEKVVRYVFRATGADGVIAAYKSVTAASNEMANAQARAATATVRGPRAPGASPAGRVSQARTEANQQAREAERAANAEVRSREKALAHVARIRDRHFVAEQRQQERLEAKQEAALAKRVRQEQRANEKIRAARNKTIDRVSDGIIGAAIGAVTAGVAAMANATGAAARESIMTRDMAGRVAVNAKLAGGSADPGALAKSFESVALATPGVSAQGVGEAALAFQSKTGKVADTDTLQTFATVASAAGAQIEDVASAAAALSNQFDIKGVDQFREALAALVVQGAKGSFELKDAATQFDRMSSAAKRFGLDKGAQGVKVLGGLSQISRSATGSSQQAATAIEATLRQLVSKSGVIKKEFGVDVFTDKSETKARDVQDVLVETIAGAKGNLPALQKVFGEEGIRAVSPMISTFNEARGAAKGSEAERTAEGVKALRKSLYDAIEAPNAWASVVDAAAGAQQSSSAQLSAAWETLKAQVTEHVVPALVPMIGNLVEMAPALEVVVQVFGLLAETLYGFSEFLKATGMIDENVQGTKSVRNEATREKMTGEIKKLEANTARTPKQEAELQRMKGALGATELAAPSLTAPGAAGRGFGAIGTLGGQTPLTGGDALEDVMRLKGPAGAEEPVVNMDGSKANAAALDAVTQAAQRAAVALQKLEDAQGRGSVFARD